MLIRISLIVAVITALAAGALDILQVRDKITTLVNQRDDERAAKGKALSDLSKTQKELTQTKDTLKQTKQELAGAESERDKAVATAAAQTKHAGELADKLAKTVQERDDAQAQLAAYKATGVSVEQVGSLNRMLKNTQEALDVANQEKGILERTVARLKNRLAMYEEPGFVVAMRADLKGKVLVCDPKWDFVVLDVGEIQGVMENGEMLVSRGGKLVAKVVIRSVEKDRSIANIMPGWKLGDVIEGDEVIPAHPAS